MKNVFGAFSEKGALANWLHITGQTDNILSYYPEIGVDIANYDYCVDPLTAQKLLPETCLDGNIKPFAFVENTPDDIVESSLTLLELFSERGGFILSPGREIPLEVRPENVAALVSVTR